ncbi:MAG: ComF family protein [Lachnospiraceae bacterium]|nr:ComF family protein [Lachnospiraceae bacterium]
MRVLDLLFPEKCPFCDEILNRKEEGVCGVCRKNLPVVTEPSCKRCGKPISSVEEEYCTDCRGKDSPLSQGTALWIYTEQVKKAMADFKYEGCYTEGTFYARELYHYRGAKILNWDPDLIIPVPLYWRKRWFRGFNQAACIASELGRLLNIPVLEGALVRSRHTKPQKGLDDKQRRNNLKGAIQVNEKYEDEICRSRRVLLVDDIYTTGSTMRECASVLRKKGVKNVYFSCLCIGRDDEYRR